MLAGRIVSITRRFRGRLEDIWLETVFDYAYNGEEILAFESLCDYLAERDVPVFDVEYSEIMNLAKDMDFDLSDISLKYGAVVD